MKIGRNNMKLIVPKKGPKYFLCHYNVLFRIWYFEGENIQSPERCEQN